MDNFSQEELRQWVSAQTACLAAPSEWQPDAAAALMRLRGRMRADLWRPARPRRLVWGMAAGLAAAAALFLPASRVIAQLWQSMTVPQVAIVRVNAWPEGVPSPEVKSFFGYGAVDPVAAAMGIRVPIPPVAARNAEEARDRVKFLPRLPRWGVMSGDPRLSTAFGMGAETTVKTADLELALRKAGVAKQSVPPQWDSAQLVLHANAVVIAEWQDMVLVQSPPLTLTAPPGFDFPAFSALILQVLGVQPDEAQRLAERAGILPLWLVPLGKDLLRNRATIEEIKLNAGSATLLEELHEDGTPSRVAILWMVSDRVYLLNGSIGRARAIAVANSVE